MAGDEPKGCPFSRLVLAFIQVAPKAHAIPQRQDWSMPSPASSFFTHRSIDSWLKRQSDPTLKAGMLRLLRGDKPLMDGRVETGPLPPMSALQPY
jgi:hypothetical protein